MPPVDVEILDRILALQLVIAWAGESAGGPQPRLGWWKSDLVDAEGGGDLFRRLMPRTHRWAGFSAARRVARLTDERLRSAHARRDEMVTIFHFGFELDEALDERLAQHKLDGHPPEERLPLLQVTAAPLEAKQLLTRLPAAGELDCAFKVIPGGRQLRRNAAEDAGTKAARLACAALTEPPNAYPLPFILEEPSRGQR